MQRLTLGALLAFTAVLTGCLGAEDSDKAGGDRPGETLVLRLANHDDSLDLDEYADAVERLSEGSVRIELENGWRRQQVDYETRTIGDVRAGKVELAKVSARAFDLVGLESFQPLVAPFAIDSYALQREVLNSDVARAMLDSVEALDLVGIALLPGDLRRPVGLSRPLLGPGDYLGARIATRPSRLGMSTYEALGARGEPVLPDDDIAAFDGADMGLLALSTDEHEGPQRTLAANVGLWPRPLVIVMNGAEYDALSEDQRGALREAGRAVLDPVLKRIGRYEREALGIICRSPSIAVRSATPAQLDALRTATAVVARSVEQDPDNRRATREIARLRREIEPEPAPSCEPGAEEGGRSRSTPVDGLWRMDSTKSEYARIAPPSDVVPENWGEFTYAFTNGRFAFTTENGEACLWAYGSYAVKGDILEWTFDDGGGISVSEDDFFNVPGEFFTYRWSRYRDRLTLEPVRGTVSPEPFRVNPWRRLDGKPTRAALARRCLPPSDALQP